MVQSIIEESIREGRLSLAAMLVGYQSTDIQQFHKDNGEMWFSDKKTQKLAARVALRNFPVAQHTNNSTGLKMALAVGIAMDQPNHLDFKKYSSDHEEMYNLGVDAMLLAWHDPEILLVPIIPSQDIWAVVRSMSPEENRYQSEIRNFWITPPIQKFNQDSERVLEVGTLEFPFNMMMIRSLVISAWQAYREDYDYFYKNCTVCSRSVNDAPGFADRWALSFKGKCNTCEIIEADLSTAIPNSW